MNLEFDFSTDDFCQKGGRVGGDDGVDNVNKVDNEEVESQFILTNGQDRMGWDGMGREVRMVRMGESERKDEVEECR